MLVHDVPAKSVFSYNGGVACLLTVRPGGLSSLTIGLRNVGMGCLSFPPHADLGPGTGL